MNFVTLCLTVAVFFLLVAAVILVCAEKIFAEAKKINRARLIK